ncbi:hypothetical protein [Thermococcus kodakarensis]|uniref:hypothetical protein n=1 Tax=Thermococcus kodakarensis TaxID=311400 RepID=UPI00117D7D56|nr:hypothetical protein [Thermococcus kodakarensis]WCN28957.1 hypothetical protein POG15_04980 [Thermococcus kodakarensis]WCN31262.1 hypothetical protein POG21_04980 [Thermococcus kodakarensis]
MKVTRILVWLGVLLGIVPITLLLGVGSPVVGLGLLVIVVLLTYFLITHPLAEAERLFAEGKSKEAKGKLTIPLIISFITGNILGFILILVGLLTCG